MTFASRDTGRPLYAQGNRMLDAALASERRENDRD
jgi:hypothetical protein